MHVHSTTRRPADAARLDSLNIRHWFLAGLDADLDGWKVVESSRYTPSLVFPCVGGRAPIAGRPCYDGGGDLPDLAWLRAQVQSGRIRAFGELLPQFIGMSPADARLEPYWKLAEEFDLPVGVHMGSGPPGAAYETSPVPFKTPLHRAAYNDPILLEDVLMRHKRLRLFVMHAGWPMAESMTALLYAHPNVHVDVASLASPRVTPRAGYYRHLRTLVENGFARRIMFGSDFPDAVEPGIAAILDAEFLTAEQKSDILCGNAMRFLRLDASVCAASPER